MTALTWSCAFCFSDNNIAYSLCWDCGKSRGESNDKRAKARAAMIDPRPAVPDLAKLSPHDMAGWLNDNNRVRSMHHNLSGNDRDGFASAGAIAGRYVRNPDDPPDSLAAWEAEPSDNMRSAFIRSHAEAINELPATPDKPRVGWYRRYAFVQLGDTQFKAACKGVFFAITSSIALIISMYCIIQALALLFEGHFL